LNGPKDKVYDVDLSYITSRGNWYQISWKGDPSKSGGVATNIGIHFFDMLIWIFGATEYSEIHHHDQSVAAGFLILERAEIKWFLSIDAQYLPQECQLSKQQQYRSIKINDEKATLIIDENGIPLKPGNMHQGDVYTIQSYAKEWKVRHRIGYTFYAETAKRILIAPEKKEWVQKGVLLTNEEIASSKVVEPKRKNKNKNKNKKDSDGITISSKQFENLMKSLEFDDDG